MNSRELGPMLFTNTVNTINNITITKMDLLNFIIALRYFLSWNKDFEVHP